MQNRNRSGDPTRDEILRLQQQVLELQKLVATRNGGNGRTTVIHRYEGRSSSWTFVLILLVVLIGAVAAWKSNMLPADVSQKVDVFVLTLPQIPVEMKPKLVEKIRWTSSPNTNSNSGAQTAAKSATTPTARIVVVTATPVPTLVPTATPMPKCPGLTWICEYIGPTAYETINGQPNVVGDVDLVVQYSAWYVRSFGGWGEDAARQAVLDAIDRRMIRDRGRIPVGRKTTVIPTVAARSPSAPAPVRK